MLETIREFAAEALDELDASETRRRHAAHVLALAEQAEPHLTGPDQAEWLARLSDDRDNLRAAIESAIEADDADTALRIAGAIWPAWEIWGEFREGTVWMIRSLQAHSEAPSPRSSTARGNLARRRCKLGR